VLPGSIVAALRDMFPTQNRDILDGCRAAFFRCADATVSVCLHVEEVGKRICDWRLC
jgi:hypothetical protein